MGRTSLLEMFASTVLLLILGVLEAHGHLTYDKPQKERRMCGGVQGLDRSLQTDRNIDNYHELWGQEGAGLIPYQIGASHAQSDHAVLKEAMAYIESVSCISFVARTNQETYLEFDRACTPEATAIASCGSCSCFSGAYVDSTRGLGKGGRVRLITGSVSLESGDYSDIGLITHELLHVLGHHHTQKRPDRDSYITIGENTSPYQFSKCTYCDPMDSAYDCMSIMHYRDWAFRKEKNTPSIVAKDPATCDVKSDNEWLRWSDIDMLNKQYQCQSPIPVVTGTGEIISHDAYTTSNYNVDASWIKYLKVAEGNKIEFTFVGDFGIENHSSCLYDWVKIVDGNLQDILPKTCGTTAPT